MKKLYTFFLGAAFTANVYSQGQITGFTVDPVSPTTTDNVFIYVDVMFTSGGCDLDGQGSSTTGSTTTGYAHHCVGMLTVICTATDTFNLGMLPAGPHTFNMTLSSSSGGPPCPPAILPDDIDSVTFTVTTATSISSVQNVADLISIYPNPVSSTATILITEKLKLKNGELKIMDAMGKNVRTISAIHTNEILLNKEELPAGIYFYQLTEGNESVTGKFVIE